MGIGMLLLNVDNSLLRIPLLLEVLMDFAGDGKNCVDDDLSVAFG